MNKSNLKDVLRCVSKNKNVFYLVVHVCVGHVG